MLQRRGARTDPCGVPFLRHCNLLHLPFLVVRVKLQLRTISMIMQRPCVCQVAIAAGCRWGHGATQCHRLLWDWQTELGLLCWKAILDVLSQQCDLVYGWPPISKAYLLLWEQWVDDWFHTSINESPEDFEGDT